MRTAEEYNNFAAGLSQKGDFIHALKYFQLALAINPNHQSILNNLGIVLNNLSRPYEALGYLQRAMLLDPPNAETHFLIGNIMHEHGFTDIALQRLKTAVKIDPRHAGALTNLGLIYKNMNRIREAVRYFRLAYVPRRRQRGWARNVQELDRVGSRCRGPDREQVGRFGK